jgi:hypothetical protein
VLAEGYGHPEAAKHLEVGQASARRPTRCRVQPSCRADPVPGDCGRRAELSVIDGTGTPPTSTRRRRHRRPTLFSLYPTEFAGTAQHTLGAFMVRDVEATVAELRGKGVRFEDYTCPG